MSAPIIALDTETTGLAPDADIWEFAGIRREPDGSETTLHLFIEHDEKKCRNLPPTFLADHLARFPGHNQETQRFRAAEAIADFLSKGESGKPHIVGCVPNFDTERIARLLIHFGYVSEWHHHLIDVETLAVGWLAGRQSMSKAGIPDLAPPWSSDDLSRVIGIEPPTTERHTAMGDALWALDIYGHIMGRAS